MDSKTVLPVDTAIAHRAKVIPPKMPARILARPRLTLTLEQALEVPVTLIVAGAGWGKTTALLQVTEEFKRRKPAPIVAWLQIDEYDSDAYALYGALVSSVEYCIPGFFKKWRSQLTQMKDAEFVRLFTGELAVLEREIVLIIEDVHEFLSNENHQPLTILSLLIEQLPPSAHCVITSRRALALECLPRMRARQQLAIVEKPAFQLSLEEVGELLNEVYHQEMEGEVVRRIAHQAQGWITGIILILQAHRVMELHDWGAGMPSVSAAIPEFFYAYFMSEVYDNLSLSMRRSLVLLAELPDWDPEAIRQVFGDAPAEEFLRYINDEHALFVSPANEERTRFRFHPMFRDFLDATGDVQMPHIRALAAYEHQQKRYYFAARLYKKSKMWGPMLESLYHAQFSSRREIFSPDEFHGMVEAVPAGLRDRLHIWWVLRAADLIKAGKPADVNKLPVKYANFREPYHSKYLTLRAVVLRNEGKFREAVELAEPLLERYLKHPEESCSQETFALAVYQALSLLDLSEITAAKQWVDWIEARKNVLPEFEDDDLMFMVLRAYYIAVKNKENALFYTDRYVDYCRNLKPSKYDMSLLHSGIARQRYELLDQAEEMFMEAEQLSKSNSHFTRLASVVQLSKVKIYQGDYEKGLQILEEIPLENKRKNAYLAIESILAELATCLRGNRTPADTILRQALETYKEYKDPTIFFTLGQVYRRTKPGQMNLFVEKEGQYFIEHSSDKIVRGLAKLAVESERMRLRPKLYPLWEKAARELFAIEGIEYWQPGEGDALYLLEALENIPDLAPKVLEIFEYFAHGIAWYLGKEWQRLEAETKSMLLQFLTARMERPHIARSVRQLLETLQIETNILESTNVIHYAASSPHLKEHEVEELLVKYGEVAESAASARKGLSEREAPPLEIRMFGAFKIIKGGAAVEFSDEITQPALSLLKLLIKNKNQPVSIDVIGAAIWKDVAEKQARDNIYKAISMLRGALEPHLLTGKDSHFIVSDEGGYKFVCRPKDEIDSDKFENLCKTAHGSKGARAAQAFIRAVELYRGPYLEENLYDEWAEPERDRLQQKYIGALEQIVSWHRNKRLWAKVETYASKGFELDPADEVFCAGLLEAATAHREFIKVKNIFSKHQEAMQELYSDVPSKSLQELYLSCIERAAL